MIFEDFKYILFNFLDTKWKVKKSKEYMKRRQYHPNLKNLITKKKILSKTFSQKLQKSQPKLEFAYFLLFFK